MSQSDRKKLQKEREKEEASDSSPFYNPEYSAKVDLNGRKFLSELKDPLDEAVKFAKKLVAIKIDNPKWAVNVYSTLGDLYLKKERPLLLIKVYNALEKIAKDHPLIHKVKVQTLYTSKPFPVSILIHAHTYS